MNIKAVVNEILPGGISADDFIRLLRDEGLAVVPIKPTPDMLLRGCAAALQPAVLLDDTRFSCERATWDAMLAEAGKL